MRTAPVVVAQKLPNDVAEVHLACGKKEIEALERTTHRFVQFHSSPGRRPLRRIVT